MLTTFEILNKGVPASINILLVDINAILELAVDKDLAEKYFKALSAYIYKKINEHVRNNEIRNIDLSIGLTLQHNKYSKSNELYISPYTFLSGFIRTLNAEKEISEYYSNKEENDEKVHNSIQKLLLNKCNALKATNTEDSLKKNYPILYESYKKERFYNKLYSMDFQRFNGNKLAFYKHEQSNGCTMSYPVLCDTLDMYNVKNFTKIYSEILKDVIINFGEISKPFLNNPTNILNDIKCDKETLEAFMASTFLEKINKSSKIEDKQNYLYYVTSYFNEHKDWIGTDKIVKHRKLKYNINDMYDKYINILVDNPELKVVDIEREEFDNFTQDEVDEYMKLELEDARSNWVYFNDKNEDERIARAIYNSTFGIKDKVKKKKTQEELKHLFMKKKMLFENSSSYRIVEGKNSFDGYLAYIYPNGRVIMEKYFERLKNGEEKIADEQAIYVMNIDEFYTISNLSKTTIIRDKLCKRYYHSGKWEEKVLKEIDKDGTNPYSDYKELVKLKKVKDTIYE